MIEQNTITRTDNIAREKVHELPGITVIEEKKNPAFLFFCNITHLLYAPDLRGRFRPALAH